MDKKIILIIGLFTIAMFAVGLFVVSSGSSKAELVKTQGAKVFVPEPNFDFKVIQYSGGNVTHSYTMKNNGNSNLQIANITTSCMCTNAYFKKGSNKSPSFGMKGMSAPSGWKGTLKPGETGEIVAVFNPSYHGPSGKGPIQRIVSFETNDPDHPYLEVNFEGTVVK